MFACARNDFNIAPTGEIKLVKGLFASGGMFQTLGVPAELGRVLTESDDRREEKTNEPERVWEHDEWTMFYLFRIISNGRSALV